MLKAQELRQTFPNMLQGGEHLIVGMINGKYDPEHFYAAKQWLNHCYNRPSNDALILEAIDGIIEGHGTESIYADNDTYHDNLLAEYINTGDTYSSTIAYIDGKYIITCIGDLIEDFERKGIKVH